MDSELGCVVLLEATVVTIRGHPQVGISLHSIKQFHYIKEMEGSEKVDVPVFCVPVFFIRRAASHTKGKATRRRALHGRVGRARLLCLRCVVARLCANSGKVSAIGAASGKM